MTKAARYETPQEQEERYQNERWDSMGWDEETKRAMREYVRAVQRGDRRPLTPTPNARSDTATSLVEQSRPAPLAYALEGLNLRSRTRPPRSHSPPLHTHQPRETDNNMPAKKSLTFKVQNIKLGGDNNKVVQKKNANTPITVTVSKARDTILGFLQGNYPSAVQETDSDTEMASTADTHSTADAADEELASGQQEAEGSEDDPMDLEGRKAETPNETEINEYIVTEPSNNRPATSSAGRQPKKLSKKDKGKQAQSRNEEDSDEDQSTAAADDTEEQAEEPEYKERVFKGPIEKTADGKIIVHKPTHEAKSSKIKKSPEERKERTDRFWADIKEFSGKYHAARNPPGPRKRSVNQKDGRYRCPLCKHCFTSSHHLQSHFRTCVKYYGNPNALTWNELINYHDAPKTNGNLYHEVVRAYLIVERIQDGHQTGVDLNGRWYGYQVYLVNTFYPADRLEDEIEQDEDDEDGDDEDGGDEDGDEQDRVDQDDDDAGEGPSGSAQVAAAPVVTVTAPAAAATPSDDNAGEGSSAGAQAAASMERNRLVSDILDQIYQADEEQLREIRGLVDDVMEWDV